MCVDGCCLCVSALQGDHRNGTYFGDCRAVRVACLHHHLSRHLLLLQVSMFLLSLLPPALTLVSVCLLSLTTRTYFSVCLLSLTPLSYCRSVCVSSLLPPALTSVSVYLLYITTRSYFSVYFLCLTTRSYFSQCVASLSYHPLLLQCVSSLFYHPLLLQSVSVSSLLPPALTSPQCVSHLSRLLLPQVRVTASSFWMAILCYSVLVRMSVVTVASSQCVMRSGHTFNGTLSQDTVLATSFCANITNAIE